MDQDYRNIAETLKDILPTPALLHMSKVRDQPARLDVATPSGFDLGTIDLSDYLPNPQRANSTANFTELQSFVTYLKTHANPATVAWAQFDPQTYALSFIGIVDDHTSDLPGWRQHRATFTPDTSVEWKTWTRQDRKPLDQIPFAEFIENNSDDIVSANGLPSDLQMMKMATEFVYNENRALKSSVRLESGGVQLTYVADPDKGTLEQMKLFDKFAIGIPVFQGGPKYSITARLKYRTNNQKVTFFYELVRTDRVHQHAASELIDIIKLAIGSIPLYLGACK